MNDIKLTKNFYLSEFECHDGSHLVKLEKRLLLLLQNLRDLLNIPIIILSGFRTIEHNNSIGGSPNSQHLHGKAADIQVENITPEELYIHAIQIGFDGIGLYETFIHVDVRGNKVHWKS